MEREEERFHHPSQKALWTSRVSRGAAEDAEKNRTEEEKEKRLGGEDWEEKIGKRREFEVFGRKSPPFA